jgi:hypothetical protein
MKNTGVSDTRGTSHLAYWKTVLLACILSPLSGLTQQNNCSFKPPLIHIHFGTGAIQDVNLTPVYDYERISGPCPTDGHYTYSPYSPGCFAGDWFILTEDHTPGDKNGNMMIVNANPGGGPFLNRMIGGFQGSHEYELALWLMNICRLHICCSDLSPHIVVQLSTRSGKKIATYLISNLDQKEVPNWRKYSGLFTMPAGEKELVLTMRDNTIGGCGNDFALDDITIRECIRPTPPAKPSPFATTSKKKELKKQETRKPAPVTTAARQEKPQPLATEKEPSRVHIPASVKNTVALPPPPTVLKTRENPLVKLIRVEEGEVRIDLYDNGQIDGDTVTVYHNNALIVAGARLSQKPITFRLAVDPAQPHHELVMVADNLGAIPPNTSLMIVTTKEKKYQVFISSSEQKNAKVVIDLSE